MSEPHRSSAGAAFARALETDPATRAAWERASARLRVVAEIWARIRTASADEREHAAREFAEAMQEALRTSGDDLGAAGFEPPRSIEEWEHLARIVEMPFKTIRAGNFTYADVHAVAMAWIDRQKMKARLTHHAGTEGAATQVSPSRTNSSSGAVIEESAPPALTPTELRVLRALATFDASELASAARVESAIDPSERVSERSIVTILRRLIELGLAERPQGERSGVRLTIAGRRLARRIAE
ncbi:MAG: hypothetical protein KF724_11655 [Phycisphaeraceae bacterium]|nr:hypothetical protein [Phycisphaeraceae bacterium]